MLAALISISLGLISLPLDSTVRSGLSCASKVVALAPTEPNPEVEFKVVWAPAAFTGHHPQLWTLDPTGRFQLASKQIDRRFFAGIRAFMVQGLDDRYRQILPPSLYSGWRKAEEATDPRYGHDLFILKNDGGVLQIAFHLRIYEGVVSQTRSIPLPVEHLSRALRTPSMNRVAIMTQELRASMRNTRLRPPSVYEVGQYVVRVEDAEGGATVKSLAAAFLSEFIRAGRESSPFIMVPGSDPHWRLYGRDFGLQRANESPIALVKGHELLEGFSKYRGVDTEELMGQEFLYLEVLRAEN